MSAQDVSINRLFVNNDMSAQDIENRLFEMTILAQDVSINRLFVNNDMSAQDVV